MHIGFTYQQTGDTISMSLSSLEEFYCMWVLHYHDEIIIFVGSIKEFIVHETYKSGKGSHI